MNNKELDAYDISRKIFSLWQLHADKSSGNIDKVFLHMPICVKTNDTYKQIINIRYDSQKGIILTLED